MPTFYAEDIDISPDEYYDSCSSDDIYELIQILIENGHINPYLSKERILSLPEGEFEDNLMKLHGKYQSLTKEEEELIAAIAKRF